MQPVALRRVSRRAQTSRSNSVHIIHTSLAAGTASQVQISAAYREILAEAAQVSRAAENLWTEHVLATARHAQEIKTQVRREAQEELERRADYQREEQQRLAEQRELDRRARDDARIEHRRQEEERISRAREVELQRQREIEEAQQREIEVAARSRRERLRPCFVCMEEQDLSVMIDLPCDHWSCPECLTSGFQTSLNSKTRFQCCEQYISVRLIQREVSEDFVVSYESMDLELSTPNPVYCASSDCAAFIPPANYAGPDIARCNNCAEETCRHCRTVAHRGRGCTADEATEQVRALAAVVGWKVCPACGMMVERRDGCLHMTCRCGSEFCYRCGGHWRNCRVLCTGRYF